MKQHIEKSQWDELSNKEKERFDEIGEIYEPLPTIGQMIEFLGDDLFKIESWNSGKWFLTVIGQKAIINKEMCDALWVACKYKLKQQYGHNYILLHERDTIRKNMKWLNEQKEILLNITGKDVKKYARKTNA